MEQEKSNDYMLKLWLALFNAKTEEDLIKLKKMNVPEINQAIEAYWETVNSEKFQELERQRHYARINEASEISHAIDADIKKVNEKEQGIVAETDAVIAKLQAQLAESGQPI